MCIGSQVPNADSQSDDNSRIAAAQLAWTTRTFRQPMKPMLPRKLTSSARINLNQYWNVLEELVPCSSPSCAPVTCQQHGGQPSFEDVDMSNEINENLANERQERQDRMSRGAPHVVARMCGKVEGMEVDQYVITPPDVSRFTASPRTQALRDIANNILNSFE